MSSNRTIWSDVVNEENLCESLLNLLPNENEKRPIASATNARDSESYQYKSYKNKNRKRRSNKKKNQRGCGVDSLKKVLNKDDCSKQAAGDSSGATTINRCSVEQMKQNENGGQRLRERLGPKVTFNESKPRMHINVSEADSEEAVARAIVRNLREPKANIISKCVKVLGKKKALELLFATEDVIEQGGLLTFEGNRKRTPGGIFIQLIKKDDSILNCQRSEIFADEYLKKKKSKALKRLKRRNNNILKQVNDPIESPTNENLSNEQKLSTYD